MTKFGNSIYFSMLFVALGLLLKCTGPELPLQEARATASTTEACQLKGTWSRCISNGTASGRITFVASEDLLSQKTDTFLSNPFCAGLPDGESITDINYKLGEAGKSAFIEDGTDIDLTSLSDLGCGAEQTVYSVVKFTDSCTKFFPVQMGPGCNSSERGLIIDTVPFERQ